VRKSLSAGIGAAAAAVLTHGMVHSASNLADSWPIWTYTGFFQWVLFAVDRLWSLVHGWTPLSHIDEFGRFYARTVHLACPLAGFVLFLILSRYKTGRNVWKPAAVLFLLAAVLQPPGVAPFRWLGLGVTAAETVQTALVVLSMIWSVGAFRMFPPKGQAEESTGDWKRRIETSLDTAR
jgi:hypothetical protein